MTTITEPEPDVLAVLPDGRTSRYGRPSSPVSGFLPGDIATVDEKLTEFHEKYEFGRIVTSTKWIELEGFTPMIEARALVWRDKDDDDYAATGHANLTPGEGEPPYSHYATETAESVAISRALRFLGITGRGRTEGDGNAD